MKAFPQPSTKYEETVCVAAISEDTRELLRLFPIRYRRLPPERRFERFDQVTLRVRKASDPRPESYHVSEESIRVTGKASSLSEESKVRLWEPLVAPSLTVLYNENKRGVGRSLGIIRPDPGSVRFWRKPAEDASEADQEVAAEVYQQASLLETPLEPLPRPKYSFGYSFTSAGRPHNYQIHDWEVQAAFHNYKARYEDEEHALKMLTDEYWQNIPSRNLHLIMGTMQKRPWQFIIIGLLRSRYDPADLRKQNQLF